MISVQSNGKFNEYFGLSTDTKPTGTGLNGSFFYEINTGKLFIYDEDGDAGSEWVEQGA